MTCGHCSTRFLADPCKSGDYCDTCESDFLWLDAQRERQSEREFDDMMNDMEIELA